MSIIGSMLVRWNRATKIILKSVAVLPLAALMVLAAALTYSTSRGYVAWWFSSNATVAVDDRENGYLHTNWAKSAVIITRADSQPKQSYLAGLNGKHVIHCGQWHAPHFPTFAIGDVNPPCSFFSNGWDLQIADNPDLSTLVVGTRFVEFHIEKGKKVTARW